MQVLPLSSRSMRHHIRGRVREQARSVLWIRSWSFCRRWGNRCGGRRGCWSRWHRCCGGLRATSATSAGMRRGRCECSGGTVRGGRSETSRRCHQLKQETRRSRSGRRQRRNVARQWGKPHPHDGHSQQEVGACPDHWKPQRRSETRGWSGLAHRSSRTTARVTSHTTPSRYLILMLDE